MFMVKFASGGSAFQLDEGAPPGEVVVDTAPVVAPPGEYEMFDWVAREYAPAPIEDVEASLLAKILVDREARLAHAEWLEFNWDAQIDPVTGPGVGYLKRLRRDEGHSFLELTPEQKTEMTEEEYISLFPLLAVTTVHTDQLNWRWGAARDAVGGEIYAKPFVAHVEQAAIDTKAAVIAATTIEDKLAAYEAADWGLPAGTTLATWPAVQTAGS